MTNTTHSQSTTDQDLRTQQNNTNKYIQGIIDSHKMTYFQEHTEKVMETYHRLHPHHSVITRIGKMQIKVS